MSEKSSHDDGKTLRQKLEAVRGGEFTDGVTSSRSKSPLTLPMIVVLLLIAGTAIGFAAAFPWLLQQPREMFVPFFAAAVIVIIVLSVTFSVLYDRTTDEWERSAARFSGQWGGMAGSSLALLLIIPLSNWIGSWVADRDQRFVQIGLMLGFLTVILAQVVCVALMRLGWTFWMSRSAREPHEKQD